MTAASFCSVSHRSLRRLHILPIPSCKMVLCGSVPAIAARHAWIPRSVLLLCSVRSSLDVVVLLRCGRARRPSDRSVARCQQEAQVCARTRADATCVWQACSRLAFTAVSLDFTLAGNFGYAQAKPSHPRLFACMHSTARLPRLHP
jgi:hypothetical protein